MALDAIYPARCLSCGEFVEGDQGLCADCWRETAFIGGTLCDSCGTPLPGAAGGDLLHCDSCLQAPPPWVRGRAALLYQGTGRRLIMALKHGDRQEIAPPAARWMAQVARPMVAEDCLVAPIPLHWRRLLRRRFNQSALLASALARELGQAWCPDLLRRIRHTPPLEGKSREERRETLAGAIALHPRRRHRLVGRPILLVDDVMTSGATLSAATLACHAAGSGPVCVVTLARVDKGP